MPGSGLLAIPSSTEPCETRRRTLLACCVAASIVTSLVCRLTTCFGMSHVASNIRVAGAKRTPLVKGLLATCKLHALPYSKSMKKELLEIDPPLAAAIDRTLSHGELRPLRTPADDEP